MRVRHIEIEFKQTFPIIPKHSDAFSSAVDPAAKLPVPAVHFQNRCRVRALGVDQDLLIKRTFVVVTSCTEKAGPPFIAAGDTQQRLLIQLGDELIFVGQMDTSLSAFRPMALFCRDAGILFRHGA
ncbi:hypothetical protein [Intestinimonas butyriciproducens]|uniref:hypothetical protein n=1 Tax=Intestinimonas butyriciproducens TaxID=1297617 RepID=UPI002430D36B